MAMKPTTAKVIWGLNQGKTEMEPRTVKVKWRQNQKVKRNGD